MAKSIYIYRCTTSIPSSKICICIMCSLKIWLILIKAKTDNLTLSIDAAKQQAQFDFHTSFQLQGERVSVNVFLCIPVPIRSWTGWMHITGPSQVPTHWGVPSWHQAQLDHAPKKHSLSAKPHVIAPSCSIVHLPLQEASFVLVWTSDWLFDIVGGDSTNFQMKRECEPIGALLGPWIPPSLHQSKDWVEAQIHQDTCFLAFMPIWLYLNVSFLLSKMELKNVKHQDQKTQGLGGSHLSTKPAGQVTAGLSKHYVYTLYTCFLHTPRTYKSKSVFHTCMILPRLKRMATQSGRIIVIIWWTKKALQTQNLWPQWGLDCRLHPVSVQNPPHARAKSQCNMYMYWLSN